MRVNNQTKKKVEDIQNLIKAGEDLSSIVKAKFSGNYNKKDTWLDKNHHLFTDEELKYLQHTITPQVIETEEIVEEVINNSKSASSNNSLEETFTLSSFSSNTLVNFEYFEDIKTPQDKLNFLFNDEVIKVLYSLTKGKVETKKEALLKVSLDNVKDKYNKDIKVKNIRISDELYKKFTAFCEKNKITIISGTTCAFEDFLNKYGEEK